MGKYSAPSDKNGKSVKARGSNLRVHFKNTRETAMACKGLLLKRAQKFLKDVIEKKDTVPFRRFHGGVPRNAQAKKHNAVQARWPEKSARYVLDLLQNAESNADAQGIPADTLVVSHIQVNQAPRLRRRTYRAHGRINPYMSSPCHIELICSQKAEAVKKPEESGDAKPKKRSQAHLKQGETA